MKKIILIFLLFCGVIYSQELLTPLVRESLLDSLLLELETKLTGGYSVTIVDAYSTPEQYGYVSGNAAVYLKMSIDSSAGRPVLWQQNYSISDTIRIDSFDEKEIVFARGSKITSIAVTDATDYYNPTGEIIFSNGNKLTITGGEIEGNIASTNGYQSVLCIRDVDEVTLNDMIVRKGKYSGTRIVNAQKFTATNCIMDSSHYANLYVSGTKQSNIYGGSYSYAGWDMTYGAADSGYGITFTGRYPYPPDTTISREFDNENITLDGVKAYYNSRDGIDMHGGVNSTVTNCKVKGFGYTGISGANEDGNTGYEKYVANRIIKNNIIIQDSTFIEQCIGNQNAYYADSGKTRVDSTKYWYYINIGDVNFYGASGPPLEPSGSWIVDGNIMYVDSNKTARGQRASIFFWASTLKGNPQIETASITNNKIINCNTTTDLFYDNDSPTLYSQDGIIHFTSGAVPPKIVTISGNSIVGTSTNGIKLTYRNPWTDDIGIPGIQDTGYANIVRIHDNDFLGTFTYPLYVSSNNISQKIHDNTYNRESLPDMKDAFSGTITKLLKCQSENDSIALTDTIEVDANGDNVKFSIKIDLTYDEAYDDVSYSFAAKAYCTADTSYFTVTQLEQEGTNAETYKPTLVWRRSGDKAVLKLITTVYYSKHIIETKFGSRNVPYWRTE